MEQKFRIWLAKQKTQRNNRFEPTQINYLCKALKKTIPSWKGVEHDNLFDVNDPSIIGDPHRCRQNGGDLYQKSRDSYTGKPSNALKRYKEFLEKNQNNKANEAIICLQLVLKIQLLPSN